MSEVNDLNEEQRKKLAMFMSCVKTNNVGMSLNVLKENNWNLEEAIIKHLEENKLDSGGIFSYALNVITYIGSSVFNAVKSLLFVDSKSQIEKTVATFRSSFGGAPPNFVNDSYAQALKKAASSEKLLFVYIHDARLPEKYSAGEYHKPEDITDFSRVLTDPTVSDFLNENFVSWMADVSDCDAKTLKNNVGFIKLPAFLITCPSLNNSFQIVFKHEGRMPAMTLLTCLVDSHQNYVSFLADKNRKTSVIREQQILRQEQDDSYQQVIQRDLETKREDALKEETRRSLIEAERSEVKRREDMKSSLLEKLGEEPAGDKGLVSAIFRLPSGESHARRFKEEDQIDKMYHFVDYQILVGESDLGEYVLVTTFPRKVHHRGQATLRESGFGERSKVIVEASGGGSC